MTHTPEELLRTVNLKVTPVRVGIIKLLYKTKQLQSAQNIHKMLTQLTYNTNLSTIYRALDKLTESNIIQEVNLHTEPQKLYEFNRKQHHHFLVCEECHKVEAIYDTSIEDIENELEQEHNFKVKRHNVEFYGTCEDCIKKQTD